MDFADWWVSYIARTMPTRCAEVWLVASAKAYINALNKLHSKQERLNPQLAA